jgi:hypothetical protein
VDKALEQKGHRKFQVLLLPHINCVWLDMLQQTCPPLGPLVSASLGGHCLLFVESMTVGSKSKARQELLKLLFIFGPAVPQHI